MVASTLPGAGHDLGCGHVDAQPRRPSAAPGHRSPSRPAARRTRPDNPLNVPITMASTYVAGGDLEYGRYGNPTWTAFEEALGALEGGSALAFSSGLAAVATILDLVGQGADRRGAPARLQRQRAADGRPRGPRPDHGRARRRHRHRRGGRRLRGRRAGVAGVADQPGARGRGHPADRGGRPRGRRLRRGRQHLRHSAAAAAARRTTRTWSCTRRRSSSPGTATCCSARSSPATRSSPTCSRSAAT